MPPGSKITGGPRSAFGHRCKSSSNSLLQSRTCWHTSSPPQPVACASTRLTSMKREVHRWHSPRLGIELGVVIYGHWGPPLLGFPTSAGDEWELEGQGMIGAIADFIEGGKVKFFSVNSINGLSFYHKSAHPFHRSYVQSVFDSYLREEVVPFIWDNCKSPGIDISTMGMSFGAYHAANTLFKHPDVIKRCFAMSGVYDLKIFMEGIFDENSFLTIPSTTSPIFPPRGSSSSSPPAIFTSRPAPARGKSAAPLTAFPRFWTPKGFVIR